MVNLPITFRHLGYLGRLGNALFEFASTVGLAAMGDTLPRFNADWIHRPYFSVPDEFFGDVNEGVEAHTLCPHIDERNRTYLQDISLFERYLPQIRQYLKPSPRAEDILSEEISEFARLEHPILSVHVRRGDNVPGQDAGVPDKENYYVLPPLEYYLRAIQMLRPDMASVAVFSDDPDWCVANLPADYVHYGLPRPKEHEPDFLTAPVLDWVDLQLMALCDRHVVTGSTFGIWGALLADSERTIRPAAVYGPYLPWVREDWLFPITWQSLELT